MSKKELFQSVATDVLVLSLLQIRPSQEPGLKHPPAHSKPTEQPESTQIDDIDPQNVVALIQKDKPSPKYPYCTRAFPMVLQRLFENYCVLSDYDAETIMNELVVEIGSAKNWDPFRIYLTLEEDVDSDEIIAVVDSDAKKALSEFAEMLSVYADNSKQVDNITYGFSFQHPREFLQMVKEFLNAYEAETLDHSVVDVDGLLSLNFEPMEGFHISRIESEFRSAANRPSIVREYLNHYDANLRKYHDSLKSDDERETDKTDILKYMPPRPMNSEREAYVIGGVLREGYWRGVISLKELEYIISLDLKEDRRDDFAFFYPN